MKRIPTRVKNPWFTAVEGQSHHVDGVISCPFAPQNGKRLRRFMNEVSHWSWMVARWLYKRIGLHGNKLKFEASVGTVDEER